MSSDSINYSMADCRMNVGRREYWLWSTVRCMTSLKMNIRLLKNVLRIRVGMEMRSALGKVLTSVRDARSTVFAGIEFGIRFPVLRKKVDRYVTDSDFDWPNISSGSLAYVSAALSGKLCLHTLFSHLPLPPHRSEQKTLTSKISPRSESKII